MARLTTSNLLTAFLNGTQNPGSTDATLLAFFYQSLDARYQLMQAQLEDYQTEQTKIATTTANQQFYHFPVGMVQLQSATITVNSIPYPMSVVNSQDIWDRMNMWILAPTIVPTFLFPRRDDFGIYPIPQAVYTITFNGNIRDRKLTNADITAGTAAVTNNSQSVVLTSSGITTSMAGRWFKYDADNYWYRITSGTTTLTLETSFEGVTASGGTYVIGETPELPEELHDTLAQGPISDYFAQVRGDVAKATWFNNVFWTGDGNNNDRTGENIRGGLIGAQKRYAERYNSVIVERRPSTGGTLNRFQTARIT